MRAIDLLPTLLFVAAASSQAQWNVVHFQRLPSQYASFYLAEMVYDPTRNHVVGTIRIQNGASPPSFETVAWEPRGWRVLSMAGPSPRISHAMAYDSSRSRVLLWGGASLGGTPIDADMWAWDGATWTRIPAPGVAPQPRSRARMVYDSARDVVVLVGGSDSTAYPSELWEWSPGSNTWSSPVRHETLRRSDHGLVHDSRRGTTVLYGGLPRNFVGTSWEDVWEWDGSRLTPRGTPQPNIRYGLGMAYDPVRERTILAGGGYDSFDPVLMQFTFAPYQDSLEWETAGWIQGPVPPGTSSQPGDTDLVYDSSGERVLLIRSTGANVVVAALETPFPPSLAVRTPGCAGSAGVPRLAAEDDHRPWVGSNWTVEVTGAPPQTTLTLLIVGLSDQSWANLSLPASLGFAGMPGCTLFQSLDSIDAVAMSQGTGARAFAIPSSAGLGGLTLHLQAFVPDPGAGNAAGAVVSNGLTAVLGVH